ncbi:MAG: host-nuclease inhibitor Gam family protein [Bacteroidetes bacterium]|nr:host-nuclease inhibitor Gam family protein [Bacteroidota bacterium]
MTRLTAKHVFNYDDLDSQLLELGRHKVFIAKAEADMNKLIQSIRADFNDKTADACSQSELIEKEIEQYCLVHKPDFDKVRTRSFVHGEVGFRTNPPKVSQLNRKYNINTTLELIKRIFKGRYVRQKEEIDKELVLADYTAKELTDENLASIGLKIDQAETFFIEPNWETIQND